MPSSPTSTISAKAKTDPDVSAARGGDRLTLDAAPHLSGESWARAIATAAFLIAAAVTLYGARAMGGGMPMPGGWSMSMMWMVMPGQSAWSAARIFLLMWQAMMVAMMLPSSWPLLAIYRRVALQEKTPRAGTATFVVGAGYFVVWLAFGAAAFGTGLWVSSVAMQSERLSRALPAAAGVALILAGLFQLSSLKQACLRHCRDPLLFLGHAWRPGLSGAFRVGAAHGAFCAACCWALMLIQMVLGVMSLPVMIAVAAVIGTEKLWKRGPLLARLVGFASILLGAVLLLRSL